MLKNPLYSLAPSEADQLKNLRDGYMEEARLPLVRESVEAEIGAYFVLAHKHETRYDHRRKYDSAQGSNLKL